MTGFAFTHDHWYRDDLPGDPDERNVRRQVSAAAWSTVAPTPTANPVLIAHSPEVTADLEISAETVRTEQFARVFSGNEVLPGMAPIAMNYGGHQFGNWAGQLGDGRAIALGEITSPTGGHHVLQLKGAGPTPYSRGADGRAVLRSSVREFLCSEAMHHLGVPTTRALSLTLTGDAVVRDMLYDGHPAPEPGAVVCRVAPSFVRFGHFELPASRGETDLLRALVDHTIRRHFPHLLAPTDLLDDDVIVAWFAEVTERTARLMVDWMRIGFVHGVMNTDNLSILGITIDYGPYGWLEDFDPGWTPNTTDAGGKRYRFGNQPQVAHWNLSRLGGALASVVDDVSDLQAVVDSYPAQFAAAWDTALAAKLGLDDAAVDVEARRTLADELLEILPLAETDMTIFFRTLGDIDITALDSSGSDAELVEPLRGAYYSDPAMSDDALADRSGNRSGAPSGDVLARTAAWLRRYAELSGTIDRSPAARRQAMHAVNPKYVLRNYLAQLAIDQAEAGAYDMIEELLDLLRHPYDDQPERDQLAQLRPDWARTRVGCSMLSCSS